MKKYLVIVMAVALILCFVACDQTLGNGDTTGTQEGSTEATSGTESSQTEDTEDSGGNTVVLPEENEPSYAILSCGDAVLELQWWRAQWNYVSNAGKQLFIDAEEGVRSLEELEVDTSAFDDEEKPFVTIRFWCGVLPDKLTVKVKSYDDSCEPLVETFELTDTDGMYSEVFGGYAFELDPKMDHDVYIIAEWNEQCLEEYGFCGSLEYAFSANVQSAEEQ